MYLVLKSDFTVAIVTVCRDNFMLTDAPYRI